MGEGVALADLNFPSSTGPSRTQIAQEVCEGELKAVLGHGPLDFPPPPAVLPH